MTPDPSSGGLTEAERERLARLMWETRIEQGGPVPDAARPNLAWDAIPDFFRDRDREVADAILASDWLADRVAAARRDLEGNCVERNVAYWKGEAEAVKARVLALAEECDLWADEDADDGLPAMAERLRAVVEQGGK